MNIIGLPLIYICYRYWQFSKIMPFDLPAISTEEHSRMIFYSKQALLVIVGAFVLTIGLEAAFQVSEQGLLASNGPALIGILVAIYFDIQAENIKRQGKERQLSEVTGRPASVIVSIILFGLFVLVGILLLVKNPQENIFTFLAIASWPALSLVAVVGLCLDKNWARMYSSILIGLVGLLYLVITIVNLVKQEENGGIVTFGFIVFCLLCWWGYSLAFGKASKSYFTYKSNT